MLQLCYCFRFWRYVPERSPILLIEARSCERFAALVPHLPENLSKFYAGLLASEARHFEHYLAFAKEEVSGREEEFDERLEDLKTLEARLISEPDDQFRFHSGTPAQ